MGSVFAGWYKASVYDPATGDVVQLNKLSIENTAWEEEIITNDSTQSNVYGGKRYKLTLGFFETDGVADLEAWERNRTPVQVVAAGSTNLQWYESVPVKVTKLPRADKRSGLNLYQIEIEKIGVNPQIYTNQNLLAYLGWQDTNGNGIPDGYSSAEGGLVNSFISPDFTVTTNDITSLTSLSHQLIFPISAVKLTASINIVSGNNLAFLRPQVLLLNYGLSTLSTLVGNAYNDAGIKSSQFTSIPNTYVWDMRFLRQSDTLADTIVSKFPALTTNGTITPGNKLMDW